MRIVHFVMKCGTLVYHYAKNIVYFLYFLPSIVYNILICIHLDRELKKQRELAAATKEEEKKKREEAKAAAAARVQAKLDAKKGKGKGKGK
jgi:hypothetical protein